MSEDKRKDQSESFDDLKEKTGEFAKAAGGMMGAFGKLAQKKGKDIPLQKKIPENSTASDRLIWRPVRY